MLIGLSLPMLALLLAAGVALDLVLGEVRRWHPLVGFGRLAWLLERRLNQKAARRLRGLTGWCLAVLPATLLAALLISLGGHWLHALALYFCIGLRSLREHTRPISTALEQQDLIAARLLTSRIVSRDTSQASEADLARAGAESLLENGNDAVFGTLFWFMLFGGPGAILFRLANTLDAMWGYRSERFNLFGRCAARIDDALNFVPARLTALSYTLLAGSLQASKRAWQCWRSQAPQWDSPNAGPVMASGAGALGIALGGAASYDGKLEQRPLLGSGQPATAPDIERAWQLVLRTTILWVVVCALVAVLLSQAGLHA